MGILFAVNTKISQYCCKVGFCFRFFKPAVVVLSWMYAGRAFLWSFSLSGDYAAALYNCFSTFVEDTVTQIRKCFFFLEMYTGYTGKAREKVSVRKKNS